MCAGSPGAYRPGSRLSIYAAEHDIVNALVRELLQEALNREGRARAAADRLLALPIAARTPQRIPDRSGAKNCMSGAKAFFDANILLYLYAGGADKRARAQELFREYTRDGCMLLSTQVVQEFYAAGSRKLGMPRRELCEATAALLDFPLIAIGPAHIRAPFKTKSGTGSPFGMP